MMRYAVLALETFAKALTLVLDYFALVRTKFINKYFEENKDLLEKAATAESYRTIVENLRNPVQISAVGRPVEDNMLILAGPGSGKTTVIVHRCANLLEVERIPARQILVLCFNHSSAMVLKKRLSKLVGRAAKRVTVATYHGAAMRLAGISIRDMAESQNKDRIDFDGIIKGAVKLLSGEKDIAGLDPDEVRDRLLAGYSHILVDEFQDTSYAQYDLLRRLTAGWSPGDGKTLFVVGDPKQSIYGWRDADLEAYEHFLEDLRAARGASVVLDRNFRSVPAVLDDQVRAQLLWLHNSVGPVSLSDEGLSVRLPVAGLQAGIRWYHQCGGKARLQELLLQKGEVDSRLIEVEEAWLGAAEAFEQAARAMMKLRHPGGVERQSESSVTLVLEDDGRTAWVNRIWKDVLVFEGVAADRAIELAKALHLTTKEELRIHRENWQLGK